MANTNASNSLFKITAGIVFVLVALGIIFIGGKLASNAIIDTLKSKKEEKIAASLKDAVAVLQKDLPFQADEFSTLEKLEADGLNAIYSYRLAYTLSDMTPTQTQELVNTAQTNVPLNICYQKEIIRDMEMGIDYVYKYYDLNDQPIIDLVISKTTCEALKPGKLQNRYGQVNYHST